MLVGVLVGAIVKYLIGDKQAVLSLKVFLYT
jgi:hypothetical protein